VGKNVEKSQIMVKMFIGNFKYSIDSKGRVAIPAKMRKYVSQEANDTFIMTRGLERCIDIYPMDYWRNVLSPKLGELNSFDTKDAMFKRLFLTDSGEDSFDAQSRLTIPKSLIEFAGIEKEVLIIGQISKIEIWNPDYYYELLNQNKDDFKDIAKEVMKS